MNTLTDAFARDYPLWLAGKAGDDRLEAEKDAAQDEFFRAIIKSGLENPKTKPEHKAALYELVRNFEHLAEEEPGQHPYFYTEILMALEHEHGLILYTPKPRQERKKTASKKGRTGK